MPAEDKTLEPWVKSDYQRLYTFAVGRLNLTDISPSVEKFDEWVNFHSRLLQIFHDSAYTSSLGISSSYGSRRLDAVTQDREALEVMSGLHNVHPLANSFIDLGCSYGLMVNWALLSGYDALGIDKEEQLVDYSKAWFIKTHKDPKRILCADFLNPDFDRFDLNGRKISDYDAAHLWIGNDKSAHEALKYLFPKMHKKAVLVVGFEGDYLGRDITDYFSRESISGKVIGGYGHRLFLQRL